MGMGDALSHHTARGSGVDAILARRAAAAGAWRRWAGAVFEASLSVTATAVWSCHSPAPNATPSSLATSQTAGAIASGRATKSIRRPMFMKEAHGGNQVDCATRSSGP